MPITEARLCPSCSSKPKETGNEKPAGKGRPEAGEVPKVDVASRAARCRWSLGRVVVCLIDSSSMAPLKPKGSLLQLLDVRVRDLRAMRVVIRPGSPSLVLLPRQLVNLSILAQPTARAILRGPPHSDCKRRSLFCAGLCGSLGGDGGTCFVEIEDGPRFRPALVGGRPRASRSVRRRRHHPLSTARSLRHE